MIKVIETQNGYDLIELSNKDFKVVVSNYGCTILRMLYKNTDVVVGYASLDDYMKRDGTYLGALVGRVANRIRKGQFELNNQSYQLAINNGPNSLHGGIDGFSYCQFDYEIKENSVIFHYVSKDGEENYPGDLDLYATYTLLNHGLEINYKATSSKDTLINITNHSYFNLNGYASNIENHLLTVHANKIACVDGDGCTTGELLNVENTPFDFNTEGCIKDKIHDDHIQLQLAKGYDHPFIFNTSNNQVILYSDITDIELTVSTTLDQAQLYSANYLENAKDYKGENLYPQYALCIETQHMPDSIHLEKEPKVILRKGDVYDETTSYTFRNRNNEY